MEGPRPAYREIVHRAVDGERADGPARKFERVHGEGVGGDHRIEVGGKRQRRRIEAEIEAGMGKRAREHLLDQRPHVPPAIAVGERNVTIPHHSSLLAGHPSRAIRAAASTSWPKASPPSLGGSAAGR